MSSDVLCDVKNYVELRKDWNDLCDNVINLYSSEFSGGSDISYHKAESNESPIIAEISSPESSPHIVHEKQIKASYSYFCDALKASGLRPKSGLLNILLDAISLKFVELENQCSNQQSPATGSSNCVPITNSRADIKSKSVLLKEDDETTDDDDTFFKSPSLISYKLKVLNRSRNLDLSPPTALLSENSFATPEKHNKYTPGAGGNKIVRRQLKMDSTKNLPEDEDGLDSNEKWNDIPGCPTITLDGTPPPLRCHSESTVLVNSKTINEQRENLNESTVSFNATILPPTSFCITVKKKKEAWIDPDLSAQKSQSKSSNNKKRFKQMNLVSMTSNMSQKKVDVTTLKEYRGGTWSSVTGKNNAAKRKSDEKVEGQDKRDKLDSSSLSDTFFGVSPVKDDSLEEFESTPITNLRPTTLVSKSKPLSPAKTNILNEDDFPANNKTLTNQKAEKFDCTIDFIKDFDNIPKRGGSHSPKFKFNEVIRKKNERAQLPGWACDICRNYYDGLESELGEQEIARIKDRCSRHRSNAPDLNNTPEGFWDTRAPSTEELYRQGYIKVAPVAFTPIARVRRKSNDSENETQ